MRSSTTILLISSLLALPALAQAPSEPRKTEPQAEAERAPADVREREDDDGEDDKDEKEDKDDKEDEDDRDDD
jgi:hypothetical protein